MRRHRIARAECRLANIRAAPDKDSETRLSIRAFLAPSNASTELWCVGAYTQDIADEKAVVNMDGYRDDVPVPAFGPRMVCTRCSIIGAFARANWQERPASESLTGRSGIRNQRFRNTVRGASIASPALLFVRDFLGLG